MNPDRRWLIGYKPHGRSLGQDKATKYAISCGSWHRFLRCSIQPIQHDRNNDNRQSGKQLVRVFPESTKRTNTSKCLSPHVSPLNSTRTTGRGVKGPLTPEKQEDNSCHGGNDWIRRATWIENSIIVIFEMSTLSVVDGREWQRQQ